jgi:hypothetical protein
MGTIKTIGVKLTPPAFVEFQAEAPSLPAWLPDTLRRYEQEVTLKVGLPTAMA